MPVTRAGSPSIATRPTTTAAQPEAPATAQTTTPTPLAGWQLTPRTTPQRATNVQGPQLSRADIEATLPNPTQQAVERALERFTQRVESALGHDALSLARGRTPVREGDALSASQRLELRNAATQLLSDTPLGALNQQLAEGVSARLAAAGVGARDLRSVRLGDLGDVGADVARDLADRLAESSPTAFYGLGASLAVAAGVTGYLGGSEKLNRLGIRPEVNQSFFNNHLEVGVGASWGPRFSDVGVSGSVVGRAQVGGGELTASVRGSSAAGLENARVGYELNRSDLRLSAGAGYDFRTERGTANLDAVYTPRPGVNLGLSGSVDTQGETRIGVGARVRF